MKIFTIGYGGRNPQEFLRLLRKNGINAIVDVRLLPNRACMGAYVKASRDDKGIQALLATGNIRYFSFVELGNIFLYFDDWKRRYQFLIDKVGDLLTERLSQVPEPFCLLCAEKRYVDCHRLIIAEFLKQKGHEVEHIE